MKKQTKTVEEVKSQIKDSVLRDQDFELYLFSKYPDLFPTDDAGELLPQFSRCWNDCPPGWMNIVEDLFACITAYQKCTTRYIPNPKRKIRNLISKFYNRIVSRAFFTHKLSKMGRAFYYKFIYSKDLSIVAKPPGVIIEQFKEKFGTLRVYASGDDIVQGMIDYATYISSKTCQNTGKRGHTRVTPSRWYVTLSDAEYKRIYNKPKQKNEQN